VSSPGPSTARPPRRSARPGRDRAAAIHGNKSQGQRVRALNDFKAGRASILVATEVAVTGPRHRAAAHVVNYELPMVPEDYVHRIGRTGRAGRPGDAISLVCVDEAPLLRGHRAAAGRRSRPRSSRASSRTAGSARSRSAGDPASRACPSPAPAPPGPGVHRPQPGQRPGRAVHAPNGQRPGRPARHAANGHG
jgi:ATP-dependent RNA helicase RhlE